MGRLKSAFFRVLIPFFFVYFFLHIGVTTWRLFRVDESRVSYQNLKDGPLLLKPGRHIKNNKNVIEAIGYGKLSAMGFGIGGRKKSRTKPKVVHPVMPVKDEGVPEIMDSIKEKLVREAKTLLANGTEFIYVAMINEAYKRMTLNWICNTAMMKNVHPRTLIISLDAGTCFSIRSQWDGTISCVSLNLPNYRSPYDWGKQQYINLLSLRANIMKLLTTNNVPYVLFETDATWFRDPFPLFRNRSIGEEDFDIIVPVKGYDGGHWDTLAFDPMFVASTNGSKSFVEEMSGMLRNDTGLYDQDVMNQLCASQHAGLVCRQFEYSEVADGKWFKMDDVDRPIPFILNNNFNSGTRNKETKQALNGFWFLAGKSEQCVISKVAKFMQTYNF